MPFFPKTSYSLFRVLVRLALLICSVALSLSFAAAKDGHVEVEFDLGEVGQLVSGDLIQEIPIGSSAEPPEFEILPGWRFLGWNGSFENVSESTIVTALFFQWDADLDGFSDDWEMEIVNADSGDAIANIEDVTPEGNFDGDAFLNMHEYAYGLSPITREVSYVVGGEFEEGDKRPLPYGLYDFASVEGGRNHSFGLRSDGSIEIWGGYRNSDESELNAPVDLGKVASITGSQRFSVAVLDDGSVVAWGENVEGLADTLGSDADIVKVRTGYSEAVALKEDGTLVGWGASVEDLVSRIPEGLGKIEDFALSFYTLILLLEDGRLELIYDDTRPSSTYSRLLIPDGVLNEEIVAIEAGSSHALALTAEGRVFAWGSINGVVISEPESIKSDVVQIAAGHWSSAALKEDGTVVFWGRGGETGRIEGEPIVQISNTLSNFVALAALPSVEITFDLGDRGVAAAADLIQELPIGFDAIPPKVDVEQGWRLTGWDRDLKDLSESLVVKAVYEHWDSDLDGMDDQWEMQIVEADLFDEIGSIEDVLPNDNFDGDPFSNLQEFEYGLRPTHTYVTQLSLEGYQHYSAIELPEGYLDIVRIYGSYGVEIGLRSDGSALYWGRRIEGMPDRFDGVRDIVAGSYFVAALYDDGTVQTWGNLSAEGLDELENVTKISAGKRRLLALTEDGSVFAYGDIEYGETTFLKSFPRIIDIAAGDAHSIYLSASGDVICSGSNLYKQSEPPEDLADVVSVHGGSGTSYALKSDGTLVGWGRYDEDIPEGLGAVESVSFGDNHSIAILRNGKVVAWGDDTEGKVSALPKSMVGIVQLLATKDHSLILFEPDSYSVEFELGSVGSLRNGSLKQIIPTGSNAEAPSIDVAEGWRFAGWDSEYTNVRRTLIVKAIFEHWDSDHDGMADSWEQRIIDNDTEDAITGIEEVLPNDNYDGDPFSNLQEYQVGFDPVVAKGSSIYGFGVSWGDNLKVPNGLDDIIQVAAGSGHSLALRADGSVVAWGDNWSGETDVPEGLSDVVMIGAGDSHSVALKSDGSLVIWGSNYWGQHSIPEGVFDIVEIAVKGHDTVALREDGRVFIWGYTDEDVPDSVTDIAALAKGDTQVYNLSLRNNGTIVQWWHGMELDLSDLGNLSDVVKIEAGGSRKAAMRRDGTLIFWNDSLELLDLEAPEGFGEIRDLEMSRDDVLFLNEDGLLRVLGPNYSSPNIGGDGLTRVVQIDAGLTHSLVLRETSQFTVNFDLGEKGSLLSGDLTPTVAEGLPALEPIIEVEEGWRLAGWSESIDSVAADLSVSAVYEQWDADLDGMDDEWEFRIVNADTNDEITSIEDVLPQGNFDGDSFANWQEYRYGLDPLQALGTKFVSWGYNVGQRGYADGYSDIVQISTARDYTLALLSNGSVLGWGSSNEYYEGKNVPDDLPPLVQVSAGERHALGLKADGSVVAWGSNFWGQCDVPEDLGNVVQVVADVGSSAAVLADGSVVCWGWNEYGQCDVPDGLFGVVQLIAADHRFAAVKANGVLVEWGRSRESWTGKGLIQVRDGVRQLSLGPSLGVGISRKGNVFEWVNPSAESVQERPFTDSAISVKAAGSHRAALDDDGQVYVWGMNDWQQIDVPEGLESVVQIDAYGSRTEVLEELPYYAIRFEIGAYGSLHAGDLEQSIAEGYGAIAPEVIADEGWRLLEWDAAHDSIASDLVVNAVYEQWDADLDGMDDAWERRIIQADTSNTLISVEDVLPGDNFDEDAFENWQEYRYGLDPVCPASTRILTWGGANRNGDYLLPEFDDFVKANGGLALRSNGRLVAWTVGDPVGNEMPFDMEPIVDMAVGASGFAIALQDNGLVRAWGSNQYGQTDVPEGLTGVIAVAAGSHHSLALTEEGTVVAWGDNRSGQNDVPEGLSNVVAIAAGVDHSLALKGNGTVVAWGEGRNSLPLGLRGVVQIAAGSNYSMAILKDGSFVSWGTEYSLDKEFPDELLGAKVTHISGLGLVASVVTTEGQLVEWGHYAGNADKVPAIRGKLLQLSHWSMSNTLALLEGCSVDFELGENLVVRSGDFEQFVEPGSSVTPPIVVGKEGWEFIGWEAYPEYVISDLSIAPIVEESTQPNDSLPDEWEIGYFGNTDQRPEEDYDRDGYSNLFEYYFGIDPRISTERFAFEISETPAGLVLNFDTITGNLSWKIEYSYNLKDWSEYEGEVLELPGVGYTSLDPKGGGRYYRIAFWKEGE